MTIRLTPRQDRLRLLQERRDRIDAEIRVLEQAERDTGPLTSADCGGEPGYKAHRRRGEKACEPCKKAHAAYARNEYAVKRQASLEQAS